MVCYPDFNDLTNNSEKDGGPLRPEGYFSDLRTFFCEGDLFDIPHSSDPLSWRGQRGDHFVRCRLNRAVANIGWAERFPAAHSQYLPFEGSGHRPILTTLEPESKKRRGMFRYDRRLKDNLEVKELVKKASSQEENILVGERIARCRFSISQWNKEQQRNSRLIIEKKKIELEAALSAQVMM